MTIFKMRIFLALVLCTLLAVPSVQAESKEREKRTGKVMGSPTRSFLNINNVSTQIYNDGNSDIDPSGNSGVVFPKGSGRTAVFESGLLWGATLDGDPQPRVGGSAYRQGLQGGSILPGGAAEDPSGANVRIYRVRPDIFPGGPAVDLTSAAAEEGGSPSALRAQYEKDWTEWPAGKGAPFNDKNNNGTYEPTVDIPGVPGADQTIWYVANDLDAGKTTFLYGAQPLGVEMQATFWAYAQDGALGNMFFRRYKLINKSVKTFRNMYVSMWSDVDLGNATDDLAGCDTTLSLGYCYNANAQDATYNPLPPPAVGFDFFQGPKLKGKKGQDLNKNGVDDSLDFAIFNGKKTAQGFINLPMTAFYYFARGDQAVTDPTQGSLAGSNEFYNFFQGKIGKTGAFFTDPSGKATTYALAGDPVNRTGWVDGQLLPAGDRRIGSASGPFDMAPADTQEVVVAQIAAGAIPGVDRLSAIGLLKFYDQQAQAAYDNFFNLATAPPAPDARAIGLDKQVVLDWGSNATRVTETESNVNQGYSFQGYNVYQLPSASADVSTGKRIATYDIIDGIGKIEDLVFDPSTGVVAKKVKQFGNDFGLKRYLTITNDELSGGTPLVNGKRYYYAVTSYNYKAGSVPNNIENPLKVLTVVPTSTAPGVRLGQNAGDTVKVAHKGPSDGSVLPLVVDPTKLNGHKYNVTFSLNATSGDYDWKALDVTANKVVLSGQVNQSGDDEYKFVDGMLLKVVGPPKGMKDWSIPSGTRRFTFANADGLEFEGFEHAIGYASPRTVFGDGSYLVGPGSIKNVLLKLAKVTDTASYNPTIDPADENVSFAYRWGRAFTAAPARPEFAPFLINKTGSGYLYQDFTKSVPLSAWDNTNPAAPRRLAVGFLENNVAGGLVDGKWWPGDFNQYNNTASSGPREWLFIFDADYQTTPNAAWTNEVTGGNQPIMYFLTVNRRGPAQFSPTGTGTDQFQILANFINTEKDTFSFTAAAAGFNAATAKEDANMINVFPNPYYGVNSEELNKYNRFVTFSHLPAKATIRIFNLAGVSVKTIEHASSSTFERWDLANESGLPVASGLYIAYIECPEIGVTKTLKIAVIQERQFLDRF